MRPIVDRAGFARLACHQCGDCCEHLKMEKSPEEIFAKVIAHENSYFAGMNHEASVTDAAMVLDMLVPTEKDEGGTQYYACRHFKRESPDKGVCTVYARRPRMCREFPYGQPQNWRRCAWHVRIVPKLLPMAKKGTP